MALPLDTIRIVLVEPAGPLNVGSIARVMKNMGLTQLVLVNPQCDPLAPEARQMAVHALDVLMAAQVVDTLPEALVGCDRAIATTARERDLPNPLNTPRQLMPWLLASSIEAALIFGREDRGLSNQELSYAQHWLKIPVNSDYSSLNLAQAVAVCCYELHQAVLGPEPIAAIAPEQTPALAPLEQLEGYYQDLENLLLEIDYLQPHTAAARMAKFRHLYHRAALSGGEVALLRGVLRQMRWALHHPSAHRNTDTEQ
ncbi:MAG: RNA methyltransferase [Spirulina sp. SIO3F2]|nr:RNA methyltransferase [Spirulina sp. SIO3F2]